MATMHHTGSFTLNHQSLPLSLFYTSIVCVLLLSSLPPFNIAPLRVLGYMLRRPPYRGSALTPSGRPAAGICSFVVRRIVSNNLSLVVGVVHHARTITQPIDCLILLIVDCMGVSQCVCAKGHVCLSARTTAFVLFSPCVLCIRHAHSLSHRPHNEIS